MTQIDTIRGIISQLVSGEIFDIDEIERKTNFPRPSIRRVLSTLSKNGSINRIDRGIFTPQLQEITKPRGGRLLDDQNFHRKFIGTQKYKGNPRQFFALTYEKNDIDREMELLEQLVVFLNENLVEASGNTGYADDIIDEREVNRRFIFPNVQVGEL